MSNMLKTFKSMAKGMGILKLCQRKIILTIKRRESKNRSNIRSNKRVRKTNGDMMELADMLDSKSSA